MSLIMITEAMKLMEETDADFGIEEKEFILLCEITKKRLNSILTP